MDSFFKTVTSINSERREYNLSKPLKNTNKEIKPNEMIYYTAAQQQCSQRQEQRMKSPLYQVTGLITNAEPMHKNTVKQTQFSNQPSSIFDFTDKRREQPFKPHCIKINEPGVGSDQVYKKQLKTQENQANRNPITDGDPKSEYIRNTKTPFPRNQIQNL